MWVIRDKRAGAYWSGEHWGSAFNAKLYSQWSKYDPDTHIQPTDEWVQLWDVDEIQFARLIAELEATGGITLGDEYEVADSMDLTVDEVDQIIERAKTWFDKQKEKI